MSPEGSEREAGGSGFERTVAFSDGVFAIAITLIVLTIDVPDLSSGGDLGAALRDLGPNVLAYFIGFAVIGLFWINHHRFFDQLERFDSRLLWLNLLFLSMICLLPFTTDVLGTYEQDSVAVAVYAVNVGAASLFDALMTAFAFRQRLFRDDVQRAWRFVIAMNLIPPAVFFCSVPIAYLDPDLAKWFWLLVAFVPRLLRRTDWLGPRPAAAEAGN
jgi:uncharacterized membrane protein